MMMMMMMVMMMMEVMMVMMVMMVMTVMMMMEVMITFPDHGHRPHHHSISFILQNYRVGVFYCYFVALFLGNIFLPTLSRRLFSVKSFRKLSLQ